MKVDMTEMLWRDVLDKKALYEEEVQRVVNILMYWVSYVKNESL